MDKEHTAIARIQEAARTSERYYKKPLIVTTSGGKDSSACVELALRAGIDFELMHNHTTADAPETVRFLRSEYKRLEGLGFPPERIIINYPVYKQRRVSMWSLIPQKLMPPTRIFRYCCAVLKEKGGIGRYITTGVRWGESKKRESRGIFESGARDPSKRIILNNDNDDRRRLFETCSLQHKAICNPIIDWTDSDVWEFIEDAKIPINPLYQCGFSRVGCIGCPMAGTAGRYKQFARYPRYQELYIKSFERMLEERRARGKDGGSWGNYTGRDVFHWWMEDKTLPGQIELEDYESEGDLEL